MFSHIMVGANDIEKSKTFYDQVLGVLGAKPGLMVPNLTGQTRYFYFLDGMTFCISEPIDKEPATAGNGSTIGFNIENEAFVIAFTPPKLNEIFFTSKIGDPIGKFLSLAIFIS